MIQNFSNIIEKNGKTIKENNLELKHNIPMGTLVEVKYDTWFGNGACEKVHARLWVIDHNRDCDGTPLYTLCKYKNPYNSKLKTYMIPIIMQIKRGFPEYKLKPIEITENINKGKNTLEWKENN